MTPQREEALRSLRLADRDIAAFEALLQHPEVPSATRSRRSRRASRLCCSRASSNFAELMI
jgi:hypothetical protein